MTTMLRQVVAMTGMDPDCKAVFWFSLFGLTLSLVLLNLLGLQFAA